ncbi:MAG: hypothetical protein HY708_02785 [Ignavibacteriae bacterium]|nr:hypothetical protein [Ignavibacteriota bacterium]
MNGAYRRLKNWVVRRMAESHLAGSDVSDAVRIANQAAQRGWSSTIGPWGRPDDTPESTVAFYATALDAVSTLPYDCYLSIKVTGLQYDLGLLTGLIDHCMSSQVRIHFDALDPDSADPTFDLLERALKVHRNMSCTLPARWRRSLKDVDRVVELGIPVRVVKGQWVDPQSPVPDVRASFLEVIRTLSGRARHVAVATHDRPLAEEALRCLLSSGTPCEMEQLSSLPQNCARLAESLHIPMRIYIPYGYPSLPYDLSFKRTRAQIVGWGMRDFLAGKHRPLPSVN